MWHCWEIPLLHPAEVIPIGPILATVGSRKNVKEEVVGLAFIKALRPVTYQIDMSTLNAFVYKADAEQYHHSLQTALEEKKNAQ